MRMVFAGLISLFVLSACVRGQKCRDGVISCRYVHKYGVELGETDWQSRGAEGHVVLTMADGTRVTKNYENGELHGDAVYTFPYTETAMRVETYKAGKLERVVVNTPSGSPEREEIYLAPKKYIVTLWYENSVPKSIEEIENQRIFKGEYFTKQGQLEGQVQDGSGIRVVREVYGNLEYTDQFEDGEIVLRTTYHPNGIPKIQTPYHHGIIAGHRKLFLPSGEPEAVEEWQNNQRNGITTLYQSGEKLSEVPYVNDAKDGIERRYRNEKELVQEIAWKSGKKHGPSHYYVDNIVHTEWYFHGNQITRTAYEQMKKKEAYTVSDPSLVTQAKSE